MMVLHSIARNVFNQQHSRIIAHSAADMLTTTFSDDALLWAEIARMMEFRQREIKMVDTTQLSTSNRLITA